MRWTKGKVVGFTGLVLAVLLAVFVSLNVGLGPNGEVNGEIISIGMDTSDPYEVPSPILTVRLENGVTVSVKNERGKPIARGDRVILAEYDKWLSGGKEYRLKAMR